MLVALWTDTGQLAPESYVTYIACRMYGCTPSELDEQDAATVSLHLAFMNAEEKVKAEKSRAAQAAAKARKGRRGR